MIRGYFDERRGPLPLVQVEVRPERRPSAMSIPFVIDTGATVTCLNPLVAALTLGISPGSASEVRSQDLIGGIGGTVRMSLVRCEFIFREGNIGHVFELDAHVPELTPMSGQIPSILGWDLLSAFKVSVDRLNGTVQLELHQL